MQALGLGLRDLLISSQITYSYRLLAIFPFNLCVPRLTGFKFNRMKDINEWGIFRRLCHEHALMMNKMTSELSEYGVEQQNPVHFSNATRLEKNDPGLADGVMLIFHMDESMFAPVPQANQV